MPGAALACALRNGGLGGPGVGPTEALPTPKPWGLEASAEPRVPSSRPSPPSPRANPIPQLGPAAPSSPETGGGVSAALGFPDLSPVA